jgi:hypothetical protein
MSFMSIAKPLMVKTQAKCPSTRPGRHVGRRSCCVYARSARIFPLGEMCNWGMKAFLQRDYIVGVQRSEWCGRK